VTALGRHAGGADGEVPAAAEAQHPGERAGVRLPRLVARHVQPDVHRAQDDVCQGRELDLRLGDAGDHRDEHGTNVDGQPLQLVVVGVQCAADLAAVLARVDDRLLGGGAGILDIVRIAGLAGVVLRLIVLDAQHDLDHVRHVRQQDGVEDARGRGQRLEAGHLGLQKQRDELGADLRTITCKCISAIGSQGHSRNRAAWSA